MPELGLFDQFTRQNKIENKIEGNQLSTALKEDNYFNGLQFWGQISRS
jgi:hypothetical protein